MNNVSYRRVMHTAGIWFGAKLASLLKISLVVGTHHLFFSCSNMIMPFIGLSAGLGGSAAICGLSLAIHTLLYGIPSLSLLAFYIPGWCAAAYLSSSHWFVRVALPLLCIGAFIVHPVGVDAWIYSMYWLIPLVIYATRREHIICQALGATFTAHAVGSVIWLYTASSTAQMWLGLIPVVACERLAFAAGMVLVYRMMLHLTELSKIIYRYTQSRIITQRS